MSETPVPSLLATLFERLQGQEALDLELKLARNSVPQSLWPTVSAFANTLGGWVLLGIGEEEGKFVVEGVSNPQALLQNIANTLRNGQKISYPACGANDLKIESVDGNDVVVLRVPAAPRKARPVYINGNAYGGTYVRRQSGDYHCTKPEVDRMMREASDVAADSSILAKFGWDDLDRDTFARYRRRHQTQNPTSVRNGYEDERFLEAIGGYGRNRETGDRGLTVAGLLMFGTPEAIREWRTRHLIDYRLMPAGADPDVRWEDRVTWEGNLFDAFATIYPRLVEGLPVPFRLEQGVRIDEGPLQVALREALVNLLVHADYAETQASLIVRSPSGFRFRNPGSSRVPDVDLLTGDQSDPRNPHLVRMFRLVGLAEEAGTGLPRIVKAWRDLGYQLPAIDPGTERYEFTLDLRHAHLLSDEDRTWLQSLGGEWSEPEQLALVLARHEGVLDNLRLRSLTGQHAADVTKVLGNLRSRGLLDMIGWGRGARYQLGSAAMLEPSLARSPDKGMSPPDKDVNPPGNEASSLGSGAAPPDTRVSPPAKPEPRAAAGAIDDVTRRELTEIAGPARNRRRLDTATRDAIIVALCARAPLSLREIASLVVRDEMYLSDVLSKLVASGRLRFLYPEQPSHPRQRYVAPEATRGR